MTIRLKNVLMTLLGFFAITCIALCFILPSAKTVKADTNYTSPLPTGAYIADYTVLDVNVGDLSGSTIKTQQAMGNASAVRFKLTATAGNTWNTYISLHSTNNYYTANTGVPNFYLAFRQNQDNNKTCTVDLKILTGKTAVNDVTNGIVSVYLPDWLNLSTAGATYNVEVGGVKVLRADGSKAGTLMYMDVDNARVVEYFYANDQLSFEGSNFNYEANQTAGSLTTYDQTIDASSATVTFANASYGVNAQPIPLVTLVTEKGGSSYGRTLAPQDYDIVYTNNDKAGTATATLTFKGRYTGTATATFEVEDVIGDAIANYTSALPSGAYLEEYSVLDVADTYGTDGVLSYAAAGECSKSYRLNGARAIKLKFSQTKSPWSVRFGIFNDNNGYLRPNNSSASVDLRNVLLDVLPNETVHNVNFTYPTGVTFSSGTVSYEFGGPKVFNESGAYIGRLFYLEINGYRVLEYFFNSADASIFNNDYFTIHDTLSASAGTSTVTITSPDAEDVSVNSVVKFTDEIVNVNGIAYPKPVVYNVKFSGGVTYTEIIEKMYYDVTYVQDDSDTGVATLVFKDKYSGTITSEYQPLDIVLVDMNGAVVTLNQTIFTKDANDIPRTPHVVAVEKNGKAVTAENYTVSYENNVDSGTGKVILTFKNNYYGKAIALFKINPILSKYHYIDANPVVMDISETYGEGNAIEITENEANGDVTVGKYFDMAGADVVKFKMTAEKNAWNNYFSLFADKTTKTYFKGNAGMIYYSLPKAGRQLELQVRNVSNVLNKYATARPTEFDIGADEGVSINVEIGAVKIFHSKDDVTTYAGRLFYIEFDGKRASEYVFLNPDVNFSGGDFFIGGNTPKIIVSKFDLGGTTPVAGGSSVNLVGNSSGVNSSVIITSKDKTNELILGISLLSVVLVAVTVTALVIKRKEN